MQPLHQISNDEVEYVRVARDLLAGRGWSFYESWRWLRAPLYPLFLAGSLWLADGELPLAAWPNVLLSVAVVFLIYRLGRELTPDRRKAPALIAAAIAALLQTHGTFAGLYMSETLFTALFSAGLLALAAWRRQGGLWRAALAGALLGLACLTRSAALIFLPVAALWLTGLGLRRPGTLRLQVVLPGLALVVGAILVIAPWTLRNCRIYGSCILIETGSAYNFWAFYEPRESLDEIHRSLEAIPNPAVRAEEATRRGLERLREDPAIILRKIPTEWIRLWVIKPIPDRFRLPSAYGDPPAAIFLSALVFDDLLYLLVLGAAPFGLALALARRDPFALLLGLWVALFVTATLLTHAESRYRHFFFMALIPLAALALESLGVRQLGSEPGGNPQQHPLRPWGSIRVLSLALAIPLALALIPLLRYYPWEWAGSGTIRSVYRGTGDILAAQGRDEAAAQAYRAALEASKTPDGWIVLGDLYRRAGNTEAAERSYAQAHETERTYVGATAVWGDLLRELGRDEEARRTFRGRYLDRQHLTEWSYLMLDPAAQAAVDVGGGLDYGYVGGFYKPEELQGATVRWTGGRGLLRLSPETDDQKQAGPPPATGDPGRIQLLLRAAGPRPDGTPVPLRICAGGHCEEVALGPTWRTVRVILPAGAGPIELHSPTFHAGGRDLGVLVDRASVKALERWGAGSPGKEEGKVVDVCACGAGEQKVVESGEEGVRIVAGKVSAGVEAKRLGASEGAAGNDGTGGIGRAVATVGGKGDEGKIG